MERFNAVATGSNQAASNLSEYLRGTYVRAGRGAGDYRQSSTDNPYDAMDPYEAYRERYGSRYLDYNNPYTVLGSQPFPERQGGDVVSLLLRMTDYLSMIADHGGFTIVEEGA